MGIRFHCPNGHKLNVKAFLAGRKAVCPKCGQKVLVPQESELRSITGKNHNPEAIDPARAVDSALGNSTSAWDANAAPHPIETVPQPTIGTPTAHPAFSALDPIAEAPMAVWYVRPPSGGQFGPAGGDVMRGWIAEGRVTADSLIWRANWPDWRSAASTFPQLVGDAPLDAAPFGAGPDVNTPVMTAPAAPVMVAPVTSTAVLSDQIVVEPTFSEAVTTEFEGSITRTRRRGRKGTDATMIVSGILMALVVILFIILGIVLSRQSEEEQSATPPKSKQEPAASAVQEPDPPVETKDSNVKPLEDQESGL